MGALLCLLSAACFGAMAIFGKYAYDAHVGLGDLLLLRFAIAAALLLVVARATGALRGLSRRSIAAGLAMGGIGYATQSGLFFGALQRMDASLLALVLYAYPVLVMLGAIALRRERASVRRIVALLVASAGTILVLGGAASGSLDGLGTAMGFGAAIAYTLYILAGDRIGVGIPPLALSALVCTGATFTFGLASAVRGGPELGFGAAKLALGGGDRGGEHGGGDPDVLRGYGEGRAVGGVDPVDAGAGGHGRAGSAGVPRGARPGAVDRRRAGAERGGGDPVAAALAEATSRR